jgi:hypothetical protein
MTPRTKLPADPGTDTAPLSDFLARRRDNGRDSTVRLARCPQRCVPMNTKHCGYGARAPESEAMLVMSQRNGHGGDRRAQRRPDAGGSVHRKLSSLPQLEAWPRLPLRVLGRSLS